MKRMILIFVFVLLIYSKGDKNETALKKNTVQTISKEKKIIRAAANLAKPEIITDPKITAITFTSKEIIGGSHYGFEYDFIIKIDKSTNLDILRFCKANFNSILSKRVTDVEVVQSILNEISIGNADIDKNPTGLRLLGASTATFDAIEFEIYLKEKNVLIMNVKYYYPL